VNRREFLKSALASAGAYGLCAAGGAIAHASVIGGKSSPSDYDLLIARVKYWGDTDLWSILPEGEQCLLREFSKLFKCRVKQQKAFRVYGKAEEFNAIMNLAQMPEFFPFAFMTGQLKYTLSQQEIDNLRRYIDRGGFLLMDDCVYQHKDDQFFKCSCEILDKVFGRDFGVLEPTHEIFHNVFDLKDGLPHVQGVKHPAMAVVINGRVSVFLSSGDIHCGWIGRFFPSRFEQAIGMGINILYYAMTT
jgi:hypothetical protein